jgi:hypothetical protein
VAENVHLMLDMLWQMNTTSINVHVNSAEANSQVIIYLDQFIKLLFIQ